MKEPLLKLSRALSRFSETERAPLSDLPDRITHVLELYDSPEINPAYKADIFNIINGSLILAEHLADAAYPASVGVRWCTYLTETLCRIISHLENRPAVARLGILWLPERILDATTYPTVVEANAELERLRRLGVTRECLIVPVTITSGHVAQPPPAPSLDLDPPLPEAPADADLPPIPEGVKPV